MKKLALIVALTAIVPQVHAGKTTTAIARGARLIVKNGIIAKNQFKINIHNPEGHLPQANERGIMTLKTEENGNITLGLKTDEMANVEYDIPPDAWTVKSTKEGVLLSVKEGNREIEILFAIERQEATDSNVAYMSMEIRRETFGGRILGSTRASNMTIGRLHVDEAGFISNSNGKELSPAVARRIMAEQLGK